MKSRFILTAAAVALAAPLVAVGNAHAEARLAPLQMASSHGVAQRYVVYTQDSPSEARTAQVRSSAARAATALGADVNHVYKYVNGFSATLTDTQLNKLRADERVQKVIQVRELVHFNEPGTSTRANVVSWGLDRIDQPTLPLDDRYSPPNRGRGVHAYVVDGGIKAGHPEFSGGRIGRGWDIVDNDSNPDDCTGHGTHVSGIVGGNTAGVANEVTLHPVRVTNCEGKGDDSLLLTAAEWIVDNAEYPAVVNMSLGTQLKEGETSVADDAIPILERAGIAAAVAAGNSLKDACRTSPARVPEAITVGSTYKNDDMSFFSNHGPCLDLFAPGSMIESADWRNDGLVWESGTSMAAPHVAGAMAIYLSRYPDATPRELEKVLVDTGVRGQVNEAKRSPNVLLQVQNLFNGPRPTPSSNTPTATPTRPTPTPTSVSPSPSDSIDPTAPPTSWRPTPTKSQTPSAPPTSAPPADGTFSNNTRVDIRDYQTATSRITSTQAGAQELTLSITAEHPCYEQLEITVITPDGRRNTVKRAGYAWNCTRWSGTKSQTYKMNSRSDGEWAVEIADKGRGHEGSLDGWSITLK